MRHQSLFQEFGKIPGILRRGIERGGHCLARSKVIWMVAAYNHHRRPGAIRRLADHARGPVFAQHAHNIAPQFDSGLQLPIGVVEEDHILHAQHCSRRSLFALARFGNRPARNWSHIGRLIRATANRICQ